MYSVHESEPRLQLYAGHVPKELRLPERSMTELFEESARRSPDRDTIRYFDKTISYGELYDIVDRFATLLATRLATRKVEKGEE